MLVTACLVSLSIASAQVSDPCCVAAIHAGYATQARSGALIQQHLQHVRNCLEGPRFGIIGPAPGTRVATGGAGDAARRFGG